MTPAQGAWAGRMGKQDQQPGSVKTHKTLGFLGYCVGRRRLTSQKITNALATPINPQEIYTDLDARARWN